MSDRKQTPRVLVVEDEFLVADMLRSILEVLGVEVIGPALSQKDGLLLAEHEKIDAAILDVNLRGESIRPIAELLTARSVPFALATGYHGDVLEGLNSNAILAKPYAESEVTTVLDTLGVLRAGD